MKRRTRNGVAWFPKGKQATSFIAIIFSASACATEPPEVSDGPSQAAFAIATTATSASGWEQYGPLPFDAYMISAAEDNARNRARSALVNACMAKAGFGEVLTVKPPPDFSGIDERRYGITNEQSAAESGYEPSSNYLKSLGNPTLERRNYSAAELVALNGSTTSDLNSKTGCFAEAEQKLGPVPEEPKRVRSLTFDVFTRSLQDPATRAGIKRWSECLAKSGYQASDPLEVQLPAGEAAKAMAVADVKCKHETKMLADWISVEKRLQQNEIDANPILFQTAKETKATAAKKIAEALGHPS